jgi:hypothetical protein
MILALRNKKWHKLECFKESENVSQNGKRVQARYRDGASQLYATRLEGVNIRNNM